MGRPLKFKLSDTTLTSDTNQTLSNLLSQTNKVKKTVTQVSVVATTAASQASNPSLTLEGLTDVTIYQPATGQAVIRNAGNTGWVNGAAGSSFATANQGFLWGPGIAEIPQGVGVTTLGFGSNTVFVFKFLLQSSWTLRKLSYIWTNTIGATGLGFAIYDVNGNKVVDPGSFNVSTGVSTLTTLSFTAVTLPPGVYYFAQATDNAGLSAPNMSFYTSISGSAIAKLANAVAHNVATAANARTSGVSGVMPATLGALTDVSDTTSAPIAMPLWTP